MKVVQLASFWRRLGAFFIDLFILNILISVALQIVYGNEIAIWLQENMEALQQQQAITPFPSPFVFPLFVGIAAIYVCVSWYKKQATPGQMMLKIRVVDATHFTTLSPNRILLRFVILYGLSFTVMTLPFIPQTISIIFLSMGLRTHKRQQGIHDLAAKSVVIRDDAVSIDPDTMTAQKTQSTTKEF